MYGCRQQEWVVDTDFPVQLLTELNKKLQINKYNDQFADIMFNGITTWLSDFLKCQNFYMYFLLDQKKINWQQQQQDIFGPENVKINFTTMVTIIN